MARKNRRINSVAHTAGTRRFQRRETGPMGDTSTWYVVVTVPAMAAKKSYICPGCDQRINTGVAHVVAWPEDDTDGQWRRHWHNGCWAARERRSITRHWG